MAQELWDVALRLNAAFNSGDSERLREVIAPDCVAHLPGTSSDAGHPPGTPRDREGWIAVWEYTRSFFPDMSTTLQSTVVDGDFVATRSIARGTHTAEFMGLPPTGRTFEMMTLNINRVRDGKVVEHWAASDNVTMLAHLGVTMPAPTPPER